MVPDFVFFTVYPTFQTPCMCLMSVYNLKTCNIVFTHYNSGGRGLQPSLSESYISYCTTVRGPDILRNVIVFGYVAFYQINTFL